MESLSDKQVGEIWKHNINNRDYYEEHLAEDIIKLILKLIEERADAWENKGSEAWEPNSRTRTKCEQRACDNFGIPYAEYLAAKEGR